MANQSILAERTELLGDSLLPPPSIPVYPSIHPSLSIHACIHPSLSIHACIPVYPCIHPSIPVYPCMHPCLSIHPSILACPHVSHLPSLIPPYATHLNPTIPYPPSTAANLSLLLLILPSTSHTLSSHPLSPLTRLDDSVRGYISSVHRRIDLRRECKG